MFFAIIYVVLWILMVLAALASDSDYPKAPKGRWVLALVLFGIIGYFLFNGQFHS